MKNVRRPIDAMHAQFEYVMLTNGGDYKIRIGFEKRSSMPSTLRRIRRENRLLQQGGADPKFELCKR